MCGTGKTRTQVSKIRHSRRRNLSEPSKVRILSRSLGRTESHPMDMSFQVKPHITHDENLEDSLEVMSEPEEEKTIPFLRYVQMINIAGELALPSRAVLSGICLYFTVILSTKLRFIPLSSTWHSIIVKPNFARFQIRSLCGLSRSQFSSCAMMRVAQDSKRVISVAAHLRKSCGLVLYF